MSDSRHVITKEKLACVNVVPEHKTTVWHGMEMTVRTMLTMKEATGFFDSVMSACYDKEHDLFFPEMVDFAFRANVVLWYACVDLPANIEEQYRLIYATDLYDTVYHEVCGAQIDALRRAIDLSTSAHFRA